MFVNNSLHVLCKFILIYYRSWEYRQGSGCYHTAINILRPHPRPPPIWCKEATHPNILRAWGETVPPHFVRFILMILLYFLLQATFWAQVPGH